MNRWPTEVPQTATHMGAVYLHDQLAGYVWQDDLGYGYCYAGAYLQQSGARPISFTLPLQPQPFRSQVLFPFFDGLIPEGWLLQLAQETWKLNPRDRMGLLLAVCQDCIGAVRVFDWAKAPKAVAVNEARLPFMPQKQL